MLNIRCKKHRKYYVRARQRQNNPEKRRKQEPAQATDRQPVDCNGVMKAISPSHERARSASRNRLYHTAIKPLTHPQKAVPVTRKSLFRTSPTRFFTTQPT